MTTFHLPHLTDLAEENPHSLNLNPPLSAPPDNIQKAKTSSSPSLFWLLPMTTRFSPTVQQLLLRPIQTVSHSSVRSFASHSKQTTLFCVLHQHATITNSHSSSMHCENAPALLQQPSLISKDRGREGEQVKKIRERGRERTVEKEP